MKKIFIYYSLSGNGDMIASYLSKKNIDIRKVTPKEKLPKNTILRILSGGFQAFIEAKPKLIDFDNNIDKYDEIIIGTPIWNGRLSCPINTVLDSINLKDKKVTFILYSGSGASPKAEEKIKLVCNNVKIIHIKEPKNNESQIEIKLSDI